MAALRQKRSQPWQGPRRVTGVFVREALSRHLDALRPMYAPVQVSGWIGTCRMVCRGRLPGGAPTAPQVCSELRPGSRVDLRAVAHRHQPISRRPRAVGRGPRSPSERACRRSTHPSTRRRPSTGGQCLRGTVAPTAHRQQVARLGSATGMPSPLPLSTLDRPRVAVMVGHDPIVR